MLIPALRPEQHLGKRGSAVARDRNPLDVPAEALLNAPQRHDCRRWPPQDRTAASHSDGSTATLVDPIRLDDSAGHEEEG